MEDKRYNVYSEFLRREYGCRVYKIPVNIPCSCPNRDGNLGKGGCIFCGESGAGYEDLPNTTDVKEQIERNMGYIRKKYKAEKFIVYFQNFSNTYLTLKDFKDYVSDACVPDVVEIAISTRPDCIRDDYLDCLKKISSGNNINVSMELGLQTVNYHTLKIINRQHSLAEFIDAVNHIKKYGFQVCVHMILDLPWDDIDDVTEGAKVLSALQVDMVKIHSLYFVKGTELSNMYLKGEVKPVKMEEYIERVMEFLKYLSPDIVIQRLVGRVPEEDSVLANWNTSWWKVRDMIEDKMESQGIFQGCMFNYLGGKALNKFAEEVKKC